MDNIKTGNLIKEIRKEKGFTQKQLADLLHITDRAVSKWERGLSAPDIALLEPLADILGISVVEIISGEKEDKTGISGDIDTAVKNILDYSGKEIENKNKRFKKKTIFTLAALFMAAVLLIPVYNGIIRGDGFAWRCIPAYIKAEKAANALENYDKQAIERYIYNSGNMPEELNNLKEQGVVIWRADTNLSRVRLEDMFLLLEIDFTILHEDIKYSVTCNGTCRNGKIELMPMAAEDLYKDYPWWILKLSETVSTYNPG